MVSKRKPKGKRTVEEKQSAMKNAYHQLDHELVNPIIEFNLRLGNTTHNMWNYLLLVYHRENDAHCPNHKVLGSSHVIIKKKKKE